MKKIIFYKLASLIVILSMGLVLSPVSIDYASDTTDIIDSDAGSLDFNSSISYLDENGNLQETDTIGFAIEKAKELKSETINPDGSVTKTSNYYSSNDETVIVLDPGHDDTHQGASSAGLLESELNLKIAKYCKAALEKYNVKVYMTRDSGKCPNGGGGNDGCLKYRVNYAKKMNADILVSIHLNINVNTSASGAEVWYPNQNYNSTVSESGKNTASDIQDSLVDLGLKDRGLKTRAAEKTLYPDDTKADYYSIIRNAKLNGIPGIIVEHCFLSNESDREKFLSTEEGLNSLGEADALGIAKAYNLNHEETNEFVDPNTGSKYKWMHRDSDGELVLLKNGKLDTAGEFVSDGKYTYFCQNDGTIMKDRLTYHPDGEHVIYFDSDGHEVFNSFAHASNSVEGESLPEGEQYYFSVFGYMYVNTVTYDDSGTKLYYINEYGQMLHDGWFTFSGDAKTGDTDKPWTFTGSRIGYAQYDGSLLVNAYTYYNGNFVYMQGNGEMK